MVYVTGSIAFDFIMDFPGKFADHIDPEKIHSINLSFFVDSLKKERGGTAPNIAYSLSLLGVKSAILGVAGSDFSDYKKFLENSGVDTSLITTVEDKPTAIAFMITDKLDNQISAFYPGALFHTEKVSLHDLPKPTLCSISPNEVNLMVKLSKQCQSANIPYIFDPGRQLPRFSNQQLLNGLNGSKLLIGNDYEISLIRKRLNKDLLKLVPVVITTLAEEGCEILTKQGLTKIPAAKPKAIVDPTGAGDAFQAGLIAGFINNLDLAVCAQMGAVTACYTVEKYGTTTHYFTKKEFQARYKKNYQKDLNI